MPALAKGKCVAAFETCSHHTFGSYYSSSLEYLSRELASLFGSDAAKTKDPRVAGKMLEKLEHLVELLSSLFSLTKHNDSLAKKNVILQQLKFGSKFVEIFVGKAIPFFQVHFQHHEKAIISIIRDVNRKCAHQLHHIISHGKREKDSNLAKEAPKAKKVLESMIHKVKMLLKKNQCMTAMGKFQRSISTVPFHRSFRPCCIAQRPWSWPRRIWTGRKWTPRTIQTTTRRIRKARTNTILTNRLDPWVGLFLLIGS